MATKSQEILLKGNTTNASAVPSSLKVREIAINALDRSLFTNDGTNIVKLYTGTTKWFDVNGNANNALKLGGILASEYINKEAFNSHINNSTIHITAAERNAWNNKWDYNEETIKAVKVNAAVNADYASSAGDADTLDNLHAVDFAKVKSHIVSGVDVNSIGYGVTDDGNMYYGPMATFGTVDYFIEIQSPYNKPELYYRQYNTNGYSDKKQFAFTDSNVASATKLQTARTLWGKLFDGSANVDGDLKDVGNITASGKATIQGDIISGGEIAAVVGEGTPAGVTDYSALTGKPSINGVTLVSGNNTLATLGIQAAGDYATNSGVTTLLADYATKTFVANNYVGKAAFNAHTADTDIHITSAERAAWNAKWDYNEATIKAIKVTSASSADSVAWTGITDKPTTFTPSAHTHTASDISGLPTNLSAFTNDVGYITGITKSMVEGVLTGDITSHTHSYLPLIGGTLNGNLYLQESKNIILRPTNSSYTAGIGYDTSGNECIALWAKNSVTRLRWNAGKDMSTLSAGTMMNITPDFEVSKASGTAIGYIGGNTLLHSGNYNSYAPTLTGTGASGTWGISISGNAATATNADTVDGKHNGELTAQYFSAGTMLTHNDTINTILSGVYSYIDADNPTGSIGNNCILVAFRTRDRTDNLQIVSTANDKTLYYRIAVNIGLPEYETWTAWRELIHSDNYTKYAPSLTGSGAYGTWGINVSGNAASATKLQTQRAIWGKPFDGTSDVNGDAHITGDLIVDGEVSALVS